MRDLIRNFVAPTVQFHKSELKKEFSTAAPHSGQPHPTTAVSLTPIVFMLVSLVAIIVFMGSGAISDFSPLILLASAMLAVGLAVATRTASRPALRHGLWRSSRQILPAVPLLLLIAVIATTWMLSGVVPTLIDYGIRLLNPRLFLVTTCAVCAVVSVLTGSSWTTIATIGVAFIGIGKVMGYSEAWVAGAIISGAYFGDKVSPLSDTTVIASSSCGVDLFDHIRFLMLTSVPSMLVAMGVFLAVGLTSVTDVASAAGPGITEALHATFSVTPITLIIPLITGVMIALRVKTLYTLAAAGAMGLAGIFLFQPHIFATLGGNSSPLSTVASILFTQTTVDSGSETLNSILTTGGIAGMLPTVSLVLCAMFFGAALLGTGMLATIAKAFTRRLSRRTSIVGATVGSGLFLNACTADQYLSIIIGGNMFRDVYSRFSLEPKLLSRTLEDSVSVTSVLIPWNSCGITQSTVLGVATGAYLPCCIFNWLSPLMSILMARIGFRIPTPAPPSAAGTGVS